mmetsp:Transcript_539/g.963  ORF Transcript_539/g.963 Transcript_539/m.963 type:complete len:116 (+) Transcript_539:142-489(+)|eukprot:CAMPEP_0184699972 /NCGR_PEP_ID=MMETSP0313-20130426/6795_1 /TAXON_ID=2792 /ORGANISM="Porphyridium aerugineum, Strain SAG 1380-2" /LENGTH=115 /DNA_ID=CAMNT_0027159219 /DNA_START=136 /DNA_END=483 /DNA_ORIENTATION=-
MGLSDILMKTPVVGSMLRAMRNWNRREMEKSLRRYGLYYDDLLNEYDPEVAKAIDQLPEWERELRNKRIKRATDLDLKKTYLAPELQAQIDVWNPYIRKRIRVLKEQRLEKQIAD